MKILSIGYALPSKKVGNEELIREILEKNSDHLTLEEKDIFESRIRRFFKMSGTDTRYHRNNGERALDFAVRAGKDAIRKAGVNPEDVDLLIYAGVGRGWVEPATANLFQSELGLTSATCFDVLDACASWIRSLSIARSFLAQKLYKMVMVLNCEFNFREYANFDIRDSRELENSFSAFTIGEAATATLLTASDVDDSEFSFKTWGEKHSLCKIALPNAKDFSPNGELLKPYSFFTAPAELLSFTIRKLVAHVKEYAPVAEKVHDIIIGHAVSVSSTSKVVQLLGLDQKRVFETHNRFGNTVSASLPLALAVAEDEGALKRGMRVLLLMGSAGVTTAYASFEYWSSGFTDNPDMVTPGQMILPEYDFESHYLSLGAARMHYLDLGQGPPVLMVHGNPSWSFMYRKLARRLSSKHRVIVPDHIGCGLSSKPTDADYRYTMATRVSDLEKLLDHLGVDDDLTLVVHDWGGLIGLCMAVRRPSRIKRIVVFNTAAFHLPEGTSLHWTLRYCRQSKMAGLAIRGLNAFAVIASRIGCRRNPMPREIRQAYLAPYRSWAERIAVLRFVQDIPVSSEDPAFGPIAETDRGLERLKHVPILICWGDRDFVFDGDFRDEWSRRFPDAELHRFPDAGHYVLEDAYEEIAPLVEAFFGKHPL